MQSRELLLFCNSVHLKLLPNFLYFMTPGAKITVYVGELSSTFQEEVYLVLYRTRSFICAQ